MDDRWANLAGRLALDLWEFEADAGVKQHSALAIEPYRGPFKGPPDARPMVREVGPLRGLPDVVRAAAADLKAAGATERLSWLEGLVEHYFGRTVKDVGKAELDDLGPRTLEHDRYGKPILTQMEVLTMLLTALIVEFRRWSAAQEARAERSPSDYKKILWSVDEIAAHEGITRKRVMQRVSEYRRAHGRDPIYVRRFPNRERGFMVHWPTYFELMLPQRANGGGGRQRSRSRRSRST